jgi:RNA polymerase-binding transcription factor
MGPICNMNVTEQQGYAAKIRDRIKQLETEDQLGQSGQAVVTLDQQSVGRLSRMDALQNQAMARAQQTRRDLEKQRLARALRRIEEDEYGYCEDCGDAIPPKRLDLDLAATRCVSCVSG